MSKIDSISEKYGLNSKANTFVGKIQSPKIKFTSIFDNNNQNLSTSVFIYSFYVAKKSLFENPLGVGINNYKNYREIFDKSLEVSKTSIEEIAHGNYPKIKFKEKYMPEMNYLITNLNKNSGSTNFSKFVTEFGFISLLILFVIFVYSFSNKLDDNIKVFFIPLIFIQTFIRGTGYFYSGFLISLIIVLMIILTLFIQKYENNKPTKI